MTPKIKTGLVFILLLSISCTKENDVSDPAVIDNYSNSAFISGQNDFNKFAAVSIGTQKWMTKNLDVKHYRNGDKIPQVTVPGKWDTLTTGAWCWFKNDSANGAVYGRLYNWYAVNDPRGLAPSGWHVPTDREWTTLSNFLGKNAGGKLKDTGTIDAGAGLWWAPNKGATNSTGFTGLPGGYRSGDDGMFGQLGGQGHWWSSTEYQTFQAWYRVLSYNYAIIYRSHQTATRRYGFSVRCIKD